MSIRFFVLFCCISFLLFNSGVTTSAKAPTIAKIAFSSNRDGNWDIWTMNPDGSDPVNLTRDAAADFSPVWSPNGQQIAFVLRKFRGFLNQADADAWQDEETIYLINHDGSGLRQLVSEKGPDALRPIWSLYGDEIIYQQEVQGATQLFKIDVGSRAKTQLTHKGNNSRADWFDPAALPVQPDVEF